MDWEIRNQSDDPSLLVSYRKSDLERLMERSNFLQRGTGKIFATGPCLYSKKSEIIKHCTTNLKLRCGANLIWMIA